MTTPDPATDDDVAPWPEPFRVSVPARADHVRALRRRLAAWLGGDHLDADLIDDVVMATSEALENCCDHAYASASSVGTMTLTARALDDALVVTVVDDGTWQTPGRETTGRGRGLAMMRQLVDDVAVESGPAGTELALTRYLRS
ncbi:ATP-binding protein [Actinomycetospora straminea]|uniref:Histidine kinase/HSP90-like ATPase domain-containing protein n=1 Tax=Actinomycetospora straminea TaxID=663607 RepID=A0ABP9EYV3_9PSEU|nr:ATP-binding protein [Actinomycetospora straminea]MDD7935746.1 ATP-binding protein [Actinomycetospora straminea]